MALGLVLLIGVSESAHAYLTSQASRYLGWKEGTARLNTLMGVNTARASWCAIFVRSMFERFGNKSPTTSGSVAGWDNNRTGAVVKTPRTGDLAFFRHSHMAIVMGASGGQDLHDFRQPAQQGDKEMRKPESVKRFCRPG